MNKIVELLGQHRSERSYLSAPVPDALLDAIVQAAHLAPTSVNSQQISIVVTRDPEQRKKISAIAGGQPWIAQAPVFITVVLDMHKTETGIALVGLQQHAHESIESLVSGCTDAGIALGALMTAARAQGLGIVPIGGIRRDPQAMIDLLQLPPHTFPVVGLVIGYVDTPAAQKPRLPLSTFCHQEKYDDSSFVQNIESYNQTLMQHWQHTGRSDGDTWSKNTAGYYQHIYFPQVLPTLLKQGFKIDQ